MNHTCLFHPSRSWSTFTDPGGIEGWVGLGWCSLVCLWFALRASLYISDRGGSMQICASLRHIIIIIINFCALILFSQSLKLASVEMYVRSGRDGDSETVNVLIRHTALKRWIATEIRRYRNAVSRGSAVQSVAVLPKIIINTVIV